jgi:hypothetical protein
MSKPTGMLGAEWGENADQVAMRIGASGSKWAPWTGGQDFEICACLDCEVNVYGMTGRVRLIRQGISLEGAQLEFTDCAAHWDALRKAISVAFGLPADGEGEPYQLWSSGEVVHLTHQPDNICVLVVAGLQFGKAYAAQLLSRGLRALLSSLQP